MIERHTISSTCVHFVHLRQEHIKWKGVAKFEDVSQEVYVYNLHVPTHKNFML
jgi:hypothetical protein